MTTTDRPQWEDCKLCGGDHWTKDHFMVDTDAPMTTDHQTVSQGPLDYGKGYVDGYNAALGQALAAVHDVAAVRLAFREDPTRESAPTTYIALDAVVEILRSGPP